MIRCTVTEPSPETTEETSAPSYRRFAAERIRASLVVVWIGLTLLFVTFFLAPDDTAAEFAGQGADRATIARADRDLHLDQSVVHQYLSFVGRFVRGDLGYSYSNRVSVERIVTFSAPVTGSIAGGALVLGLLIGVPAGLLLSRRGKPIGMPTRGLTALSLSFGPFLLGMGLLVLDFHTGFVKQYGYCDFFFPPRGQCGGPIDWARQLVLPWISLAVPFAGIYTRIVRVLANEVRAGGTNARAVATMARRLVLDASWIIGATIFVEQVFDVPGLARWFFVSMENFDLPTMLGILEFLLFLQIAIYLVGTLAGGALSKDWRRT